MRMCVYVTVIYFRFSYTYCCLATVGAVLIGDALNSRHPLTGSGMSVCLRDVELLVRAFAPISLHDEEVRSQLSGVS